VAKVFCATRNSCTILAKQLIRDAQHGKLVLVESPQHAQVLRAAAATLDGTLQMAWSERAGH